MSDFGRSLKHEKTQQALVGLGSATLAAAVALPMYGISNFPKGVPKCNKENRKKETSEETEQNKPANKKPTQQPTSY